MKTRTLLLSLALLGVVTLPAEAHFRLDEPADALVVAAGDGDPTGGDQKTPPCGTGTTPSNKVTRVAPGAKLHVKIKETIKHGGHYRIALAANRADLKSPTPQVTLNNCVSAPIENPPVAPVLADGLFKHGQTETIPEFWETDITLPNEPCPNCTLQVIEFMTPHAPGCFYYHCATIDVSADAPADGGVVASDASTGGSAPSDEEKEGTSGSTPRRRKLSSTDTSGCASTPGAARGGFAVLVAFVALSVLRRRRATSRPSRLPSPP